MMKGALVKLDTGATAGIPVVVLFQFNPETLRHTLSHAPAGPERPGQAGSSALAVAGEPGETFSFTLSMDIDDPLSGPSPGAGLVSSAAGIYPRLAALEALLYPPNPEPRAKAGDGRDAPTAQLPAVLFVWGGARILPVRITSLSVTETLFDAALNPTHAEAQVDLRVLTPSDFDSLPPAVSKFANLAYEYTRTLRNGMVAANLGNAATSVLSIVSSALKPVGPP